MEDYGLLLLDLGLPRKSGLDWLRGLRLRGNRIPVLILTARDAVADQWRAWMAARMTIWSNPSTWTNSPLAARASCARRWGAPSRCCDMGT